MTTYQPLLAECLVMLERKRQFVSQRSLKLTLQISPHTKFDLSALLDGGLRQ